VTATVEGMEEPNRSEEPNLSQSSEDDWLAGADVEAHGQDVSLGDLDVSLDGLDAPEPTDPNVA
jgi:hypothetical protein